MEPKPIERLAARPWRIMQFVYPPDGPRYAVCVDALATHADALRECAMMMLTAPAWSVWVESAPEWMPC